MISFLAKHAQFGCKGVFMLLHEVLADSVLRQHWGIQGLVNIGMSMKHKSPVGVFGMSENVKVTKCFFLTTAFDLELRQTLP